MNEKDGADGGDGLLQKPPEDALHVLTGRILKCAFELHNTLGCGFLEKVYENAMLVGLEREGLKARQQVPTRVHYQGVEVGEYYADLVVNNEVLVEIKAAEKNGSMHIAQVLNYLRATGLPIGLLINFGSPRLQFRRLTNPGNCNLRQLRQN